MKKVWIKITGMVMAAMLLAFAADMEPIQMQVYAEEDASDSDKESAYRIGTSPKKQRMTNARFSTVSPAYRFIFFLFIYTSSLMLRLVNIDMTIIKIKIIMETADDKP